MTERAYDRTPGTRYPTIHYAKGLAPRPSTVIFHEVNMQRIEGNAHVRIAGNYLIFTDEYGNKQVRFFRAGDVADFADLLACVGELKLHGTDYILRNTTKYQEAA